jgi:hypothetical protein
MCEPVTLFTATWMRQAPLDHPTQRSFGLLELATLRVLLSLRFKTETQYFYSAFKVHAYRLVQRLFSVYNKQLFRVIALSYQTFADFGGIEPRSISAPIPLAAKLCYGGSTSEE